jgi:hypothetical protein
MHSWQQSPTTEKLWRGIERRRRHRVRIFIDARRDCVDHDLGAYQDSYEAYLQTSNTEIEALQD